MTSHWTDTNADRRRAIIGLACPFNTLARGLWLDGAKWERYRPGAFARAIATRDVHVAVSHEIHSRLSTEEGSLRLFEQPTGLYFGLHIRTPVAETLLEHADRGAYCGVSIGFSRSLSEWSDDANGVRVVSACALNEISLIPRWSAPAFRDTFVRVVDLNSRPWAA